LPITDTRGAGKVLRVARRNHPDKKRESGQFRQKTGEGVQTQSGEVGAFGADDSGRDLLHRSFGDKEIASAVDTANSEPSRNGNQHRQLFHVSYVDVHREA
jgi:hypothetical protein